MYALHTWHKFFIYLPVYLTGGSSLVICCPFLTQSKLEKIISNTPVIKTAAFLNGKIVGIILLKLFSLKKCNTPAPNKIAEYIARKKKDRKSTRLKSSHVSISYAVFY